MSVKSRKTDHGLVLTPDQVRDWGRVTIDHCRSFFNPALDIDRQLMAAADRRAERSMRGGQLPPPANRGGKSSDGSGCDNTVKLVLEDGEIKEVPKRRGWGGSSAIVDWLNFTVGAETFNEDDPAIDADSLGFLVIPDIPKEIVCISRALARIVGYGITAKLGYGQNFYRSSYVLGENWGTVSIGGQKETILVSISGVGLAACRPGWEPKLVKFLETAQRSRITRVDLAHDDYTGSTYSVERADTDHTAGLFNCGGRNPRCEYRGDWKNPDGRGRSFYVGNRKNGKYCRVYEKGRELGDPSSNWVRVEVEFKSVDRLIPFDVLLVPGEYLAAAYPAFVWIAEHQERIETTQKVVSAGVDRAIETVKHQFGNYITSLVSLLGVDEFIRRCSRNDKEPRFMKVPHYSFAGAGVHEIANFSASLCAV